MKFPFLELAAAACVLAGGAWISSSALSEQGTPVEYSFREAPLNALGIKSLAELRGKPIVIDFWGRN
jgi:hypothetical protein